MQSTKDINSDRLGHLVRKFSPGNLNGRVFAEIRSKDPTVPNINRVEIKESGTTYGTANNRIGTSATDTWIRVYKNGLVSELGRFYSNGIEVTDLYELSYRRLLPLIMQSVNLSVENNPRGYETSTLGQFHAFHGQSQLDYATSGGLVDVLGSWSLNLDCTRGVSIDAATLNKDLVGRADNYACKFAFSNGLPVRMNYAYIENYGMFVLTKKVTVNSTTIYTISEFKTS